MKKHLLPRLFPALLPFLLIPAPAFAFSRVGHESIAELAYQSPDLSPAAKAAIDRILKTADPLHPGQPETVADAAEWPDEIKPPRGVYSKEPWAKTFIHDHPNHHLWHFVNFPVGSLQYDPANSTYAVSTDIVHSVRGCIAVLEGTGDFDHLTQLDALRYLLHLVGDAHQPLHTIAGYFDIHDPQHPRLFPADQPIPATAWKDSGGNYLFYSGTKEFHAAWDADIVNAIAGQNTAKLVQTLAPSIKASSDTNTGNYHDWISTWVSASMLVARDAYSGITFNAYETTPEKGILITLPADYIHTEAATERLQITKGATHLLQLLNAIHWAN